MDVQYAVTSNNFIMVLLKNEKLYILGDNANGQLGDGSAKPVREDCYSLGITPYSSEPIFVFDYVKFIASGSYTAAAITKTGDLWIWGDNSYGQIGNGRKGNVLYLEEVMGRLGMAGFQGNRVKAFLVRIFVP